ncbi:MAG: ParB/RepB/Spo0J family partition protein [Nitrospiria bacterium]
MDLEDQIKERRKKAKMKKEAGSVTSEQAEELVTVADEKAFIIPINRIEIQSQARKTFSDLEGLAKTIKEQGQLQPVIVKKIGFERYLLVDGERRLRAIRDILREKTIHAVLRDVELEGADIRFTQLIANRQRDDYPPLELAEEFADLKKTYGFTDAVLAERLGMDQSWIYKQRSLAAAPPEIKERLRNGSLAVTTYLNNKKTILEKRKRKVFLKVPYEDALAVAKLLQKISERSETGTDIDIANKPRKKDLLAILSKRAPELLALLNEEEKDH